MSDEAKPVKVNIGAGTVRKEGFLSVDKLPFEGIDVVMDCGHDRWPWDNNSVDEVECSHMLEHLTAPERIHFANELYRVLKKGGKAFIVTPHWASPRAYGDLTHQWPPVCEWWFAYLNAEWRKVNAPHNTEYTCDFDLPTPFYGLRADLIDRNPEYVQYALLNFKDAAQDLMVWVNKTR